MISRVFKYWISLRSNRTCDHSKLRRYSAITYSSYLLSGETLGEGAGGLSYH